MHFENSLKYILMTLLEKKDVQISREKLSNNDDNHLIV